MQTRHRIPAIFSLYMVDVLCCALGCVIVLWLVNLREAGQRAEEAGEMGQRLATARDELAALHKEADALKAQLADTTGQAAAIRDALQAAEERARAATARLQATEIDRDKTRAEVERLGKQVAMLRQDYTAAEARLTRQTEASRDLEKKLTAAGQRVAALETLLRDKDTLISENAHKNDAQLKQLRDEVRTYKDKFAAEEALAQALEKELGERKRELSETEKKLALAMPFQDKNKAAEAQLLTLEKELADARRNLEGLQGEVGRARAAAENRFAGIALTGRRVIFLVDMSGSMELVDDKTAAPDKWTAVRETLVKVMRSLPDLEKFQVILFADKTSYLLGSDDRWLNYDSKASPDKVAQALAAVKPRGGTNMYAALETAFRLQPAGLDTIYLFSDGLPNAGEGLSAEAARTLKETEKAEILSKHLRKKLLSDWNRTGAGRTRVRINAVGFFYESPDVGAFLWALSRENDGSFVGMSKP